LSFMKYTCGAHPFRQLAVQKKRTDYVEEGYDYGNNMPLYVDRYDVHYSWVRPNFEDDSISVRAASKRSSGSGRSSRSSGGRQPSSYSKMPPPPVRAMPRFTPPPPPPPPMPHTYVPRQPSPVNYMPMPMASGANDGFFDLNASQDPMPSGPTPAFFDLGPPPPPNAPAAAPAFFNVGNGGGGDRKYEDWSD
ncbi:hypothetical protein ACHAP0_009081, partial [Verticillium nonalfalfae]